MLQMPYNEFQLHLFVQPVQQDGNKEQMLGYYFTALCWFFNDLEWIIHNSAHWWLLHNFQHLHVPHVTQQSNNILNIPCKNELFYGFALEIELLVQ